MNHVTEDQLQPWLDADDLYSALTRLELGQAVELRDAVMRLLGHEDPDVREESLRVLLIRWKDASCRRHAVRLVRDDPDSQVRCGACYGLSSISSEFTRVEDTRILLSVVHDQDVDPQVRASAYDALLIMHRRRTFPPMCGDLDFAKDIDWDWLGQLERSLASPPG